MGKCRVPFIAGGGGGDGIAVVTTAGDLGAFKRGLGTDGSATATMSIALPAKPAGDDWYQGFLNFKYISDDVALAMWDDNYSYYSTYGSARYEVRLNYAFYKDNGTSFTQLKTGMLWSSTDQDLAVYYRFEDFVVEGNTIVLVAPSSKASKNTLIICGTINSDYTIGNVKTLQHTGTYNSDKYEATGDVHAIDATHFVFGAYRGMCFYNSNNGYPTEYPVHLTVGSSLTTKNLDTAFEYCPYYGMAVGKYKGGLVVLGVVASRDYISGAAGANAAFITASGTLYKSAAVNVTDKRYVPHTIGALHMGNGKFLLPTGSLTWLFTLNEACTAWSAVRCATTDFPGITDIGANTVADETQVVGLRPLAHKRAIVDIEDAVTITNRKYLGIMIEDAGEYGALQLGESTALTAWNVNAETYGYSSYNSSYTIVEPFKCSRGNMRAIGYYVETPYGGDYSTVHVAKIESLLRLAGCPNGTYKYKKSGDKVTWLI